MDVSPRLHCGRIWHAAAGQGSTSVVLSTGPSAPIFNLYLLMFLLGHCCCQVRGCVRV